MAAWDEISSAVFWYVQGGFGEILKIYAKLRGGKGRARKYGNEQGPEERVSIWSGGVGGKT